MLYEHHPLHEFFEAVSQNRLEDVAAFMSREPELARHGTDCHGNTALMLAVWKGFICLCELLIRGSDLDATNDAGQTATMVAAIKGHPKILILLLNAGADPDIPDLARRTPLMMACQHGLFRTVEVLIRSGASLYLADQQGLTIAEYSSKEMLKFLNQFVEQPQRGQSHWDTGMDCGRLIHELEVGCRNGSFVNRRPLADLLCRPGMQGMLDSFDNMI